MSAPTVRVARAGDAAGLAALWATAFTPALRPDQWLLDDERLAHTFVAEDAEGICGSIHGLPKRLREDGGGVAAVHAIGSVAVAERARGHGLARQLVAASLDAGREAGADWALLFTGTPDVYRSSGFEVFSMPRTLTGRWVAPPLAGTPDRVVRESVSPGSMGSLRAVYADSREGRVVLAPVRSGRDWAMAEARLGGATLYRRIERSTTLGYAVADIDGEVGTLLECAVIPDAEHTPGAHADLLAAVAADWTTARVSSCDLAVPAVPEEEHALRAFAPDAVRQDDRTGMIRPLRRAARLHGIRHFTAADYF